MEMELQAHFNWNGMGMEWEWNGLVAPVTGLICCLQTTQETLVPSQTDTKTSYF